MRPQGSNVQWQYTPSSGRCAIVGGYVYRGTRLPALTGMYLYADLCSGEIFGLSQVTPGVWQSTLLLSSGLSILTLVRTSSTNCTSGVTMGRSTSSLLAHDHSVVLKRFSLPQHPWAVSQ